jgi:hypothetical protein
LGTVPVTKDCLSIALKLVDWRAKCAVGQKFARGETVGIDVENRNFAMHAKGHAAGNQLP